MGAIKGNRRATALGVGIVATTILLAFALVYANSYSTRLVTANSRALHWTNASLGSGAILRAASNQAVLFAREAALGVSTETAAELAAAEADRALIAFSEASEDAGIALGEAPAGLERLLGEVADASEDAVEQARSDNWEAALDTLNQDLEPAYRDLTALLAEEQTEILARIDQTEDFAGLMSGVIRFLAVLLVPTIVLVIYRRITRRQIREEKRDLSARLEYERKVSEAKDHLLAGVSHQLRTPLTSIYGMSHVLVSETRPDPDTVRELLGTIHSEAYELDRMVADLLVMARLDSEAVLFKAEPVDVEQAINLAVEPARRAGHDIAVDAPIGVVAVADQARLVHILRTLLSNAKKHGGPSTRVFTTCTTGKVAITVEDDGRGPETPDTLFEGFTNVGKEALIIGSVGIGLNVAQGLARKMNGQITFTRAEGLTRFNVILPLHESSRQLAPLEPVYGVA